MKRTNENQIIDIVNSGGFKAATDKIFDLQVDQSSVFSVLLNGAVVNGDVITPQQYGAVADGSTDDTTAVASALAAASGKTLYFPAGTYKITTWTAYTQTYDLKLVGAGMGLSRILGTSSAQSFITAGSGNSIDISDLAFDQVERVVNITTATPGDITIDRVEFDAGAVMVRDYSTTTTTMGDLKIRDCWAHDLVDSVTPGTTGLCRMFPTIAAGDIEITGNVIENLSTTKLLVGIYIAGQEVTTYKSQLIANNKIRNLTHTDSGSSETSIYGILSFGPHAKIINNTVHTITIAGGSFSVHGIYTKASYCEVIGNSVIDAAQGSVGAITVKGWRRGTTNTNDSPASYRIAITNNHLVNSDPGTITDSIGIQISEGDEITIANNTIEGFFDGCQILEGTTVAGNVFRGSTNRNVRAVQSTGSLDSMSIVNNVFQDFAPVAASRAHVWLQATDDMQDVVVSGNVTKNTTASGSTYFVWLEGRSGKTMDNVLILGNVFDSGTNGGYYINRVSGTFTACRYLDNIGTTSNAGDGVTDMLVRHTGTGVPSLSCSAGSIWNRSDGGAGTSLYVKESSTGSSDWVAK